MPDELRVIRDAVEFIGFHQGWDALIHVVLKRHGVTMKDEVTTDYHTACLHNLDGPGVWSIIGAIFGNGTVPPLCEGPATCLECIARAPR